MKFFSTIHKFAGQPDIYLFGLVLLSISLPLSKFTTSIAQFILVGNWLLRPELFGRVKNLKNNLALFTFLGIIAISLAGLFHTTNYNYALHDLKTKLPLFLIPVVIASSEKLNAKQLQTIILFYILALLVSSGTSAFLYFTKYPHDIYNLREISVFVPYISLSVQICIGLSLLVFLVLFGRQFNFKIKIISFLASIWFVCFLFILQSFTGIIILLVLIGFFLFKLIRKTPGLWLKTSLIMLIAGAFLFLSGHTIFEIIDNNKIKESREIQSDLLTSRGNKYFNNVDNLQMENGYFVHRYICEKELKEAWNIRSQINFDSLDMAGHRIKYTIIRYLTSMGLKKDADGINKLQEDDIKMIQAGYANKIFKKKYSIYPKIYVSLQQIETLKQGGLGRGNSVTQRIVAYQIGLKIISENLLFGVGTGDIETTFEKEYNKRYSNFLKFSDSIGVNQFISTTVIFGIIGLLILLFAIFYPVFGLKKYKSNFVWILITIFLFYMLSEEIFKFQTPTTLFAYFYSIFIFGLSDTQT